MLCSVVTAFKEKQKKQTLTQMERQVLPRESLTRLGLQCRPRNSLFDPEPLSRETEISL